MRSGLYVALVAVNRDQADFDNGCDVRHRAAIKPRNAVPLYVTGLGRIARAQSPRVVGRHKASLGERVGDALHKGATR